jgi:hypothetical protein
MLERGNFGFPYKISSDHLLECDVLLTWNSTNMSNFFGGVVSNNFVKFYEAVSNHTAAGKPVLFRSGDSENEIYDYREMVLARTKNENFKLKNQAAVDTLTNLPEIDYSKFYLLVNGEKDMFDWVTDTYTVRTKSKITQATCDQALYLGDDMFFQVNERYTNCAPVPVEVDPDIDVLVSVNFDGAAVHVPTGPYDPNPPSKNLFWIGFIDGRNSKRQQIFQDLFPAASVNFIIQTNKDVNLAGITCINEPIEGDTPEYFQHLSNHLGYLFVGKGNPTCSYVNKTIYDCYVAGLPVLVYAPTDQTKMIYGTITDCYFSTPDELEVLYKNLLNPKWRDLLVELQAEEISFRLSVGTAKGKKQLESFKSKIVSKSDTVQPLLIF